MEVIYVPWSKVAIYIWNGHDTFNRESLQWGPINPYTTGLIFPIPYNMEMMGV